ncbi:MAG TPA: putative lipid II flippase FtsW [Firmicutes bacterium]|nr:putative lipid II flippase FtsW [Bacillota bacterium]
MPGLPARKKQPDFLLLLSVIGLLLLGIIMVFSASQYMAANSDINDGLYYLKKQCLWAVLGLAALVFMLKIDYHFLKKLALPGLIAAVICLILVKVGAGASSLGAERTLVLGPIHFQPSEFVKLALILFFAYNMSEHQDVMGTFRYGFLPHVIVLAVFCGLIMLQPDLGTSVALAGTAFLMMVSGGVKFRYLAALIGLGVVLVGLAIWLEPFRMARFTAFLDPWEDPLGYGFQTVQSLIAIGTGGFSGVGLGAGGSKWYYLPEVHTDFIFSIIGEELGFVGTVFTVLLFAVFVWRGIRIALSLEDSFGALLALGITAMVGVQTLINFFVATGMMPVTGIALPFISYGGSSLLFTLAAAGVLLNLSSYMPKGGS